MIRPVARIAFIADVHVGNPKTHPLGESRPGITGRGELVLNTLRYAAKVAKDCDALVCLGDLFDGTHPNPQTVAAVHDIVDGVPFFLALLGNHEMSSNRPGDHSLGPLLPLAEVYERPCVEQIDLGAKLVMVPFRPGEADSWLPGAMDEASSNHGFSVVGSTLCLHLGLADEATKHFLQGAHDCVAVEWLRGEMAKRGISRAVAGNWHEHKAWSDDIVQVGCLCPTGWNNPGLDDYGWMTVWDDRRAEHGFESFQVPGPRFVKAKTEDELRELVDACPGNCDLFVEWEVDAAQLEQANLKLLGMAEENSIRFGKAVPRGAGDAEQIARAAAEAVTNAENMEASLRAYVAQLELPSGVDRAEVLEKAQEYLKL